MAAAAANASNVSDVMRNLGLSPRHARHRVWVREHLMSYEVATHLVEQARTGGLESRTCARVGCVVTYECSTLSKKKYCSRRCACTVNNTGRRVRVDHHCPGCDAVVTAQRYCSVSCRSEHRISRWLRGEISATNKYALAGWAREWVLQRSGLRCEAIDERDGKRCRENRLHPRSARTVLQVDHIDGNWKNDRPENLRAICPTCHALTETFGKYNKGPGRAWRRDYSQFEPKRSA